MSEEKNAARKMYHHGDLKAALIEATRQLVEEHGPDNFSVAQAARLAGVSSGAPYKHFKDRDEMLKAVAMDGMKRKYERLVKALEPLPKGSLDRIETLGRLYVDFALNEPGVFRLVFGFSDNDGEDEPLMNQGLMTHGMVQQTVAECLGEDTINDDARERTMILWSFVHGLSFLVIDCKLTTLKIDVDIDALLKTMTRKMFPEFDDART